MYIIYGILFYFATAFTGVAFIESWKNDVIKLSVVCFVFSIVFAVSTIFCFAKFSEEKVREEIVKENLNQEGIKMKTSMNFGEALELLKQGKKVSRIGWNGKGMFLWLKPATTIKSEWCKDPMLKTLVDENGGEILALGTICIYTHDSTGRKAILTGWIPSQSDMLSNDWMEIK